MIDENFESQRQQNPDMRDFLKRMVDLIHMLEDATKCKGPSFNHFTVNTGHNLVQTEEFFPNDPVVNEKLREMAQESLTPEGAWVIGDIRFRCVTHGDTYEIYVFSCSDGDETPLMLSVGAKTEEAAKEMWDNIKKCNNPAVISLMNHRPRAPFVADFLLGSIDLDIMDAQSRAFFETGMSGDFCKCMGWVFLFPEFLAS